jgi:hypothetical protein
LIIRFEIVVGSVFDAGFDPVNFVVDFVVLVEQPGEMRIVYLQVMDGVPVFG